MIVRFDSVEQFLIRAADGQTLRAASSSHDWDMGISGPEARRMAREGDPSIAASCDADIARLALASGHETRMAYQDSVAGTRVIVPAYLASNPNCMRRRVKRESDTRHVSIYVALESSGGIDASVMLRRGKAVLSLLAALQAARVSVDLYLCMGTYIPADRKDLWWICRVESRPLDLSTAGFTIAHPAFCRNVVYETLRPYGYCGKWAEAYSRNGDAESPKAQAAAREAMGIAPTDIFVAPCWFHDPCVRTPEAWVRDRVSQIVGAPRSARKHAPSTAWAHARPMDPSP